MSWYDLAKDIHAHRVRIWATIKRGWRRGLEAIPFVGKRLAARRGAREDAERDRRQNEYLMRHGWVDLKTGKELPPDHWD